MQVLVCNVLYLTRLIPCFFFTLSDDLEYERAFAALDELNLARLKPFFKKEFLHVIFLFLFPLLHLYLPKFSQ